MRRVTLTGLIVAVALTGCGTSTTQPPAAGGRTEHPSATGGPAGRPSATGGPAERPPTCYPAIITENSGNGPSYHVRICDALLKPRPGQEWQLTVDGGPIANRAVILGQQVPR